MHLRSYTVYDEEGSEFALKLFINDEDSDSDSEEEDDDDYPGSFKKEGPERPIPSIGISSPSIF